MKVHNFWHDKKVLITGHTGFKGSWLASLLHEHGANVSGLSLEIHDENSFYSAANINKILSKEYFIDINDCQKVAEVFQEENFDIVFHLAAQSLVLPSYLDPAGTFGTNIFGTINVLQGARQLKSTCVVVVVTSDKCYENLELGRPFLESDPMGGLDPYSASKGCAEIVTRSLANTWKNQKSLRIMTARAGTVFGGGDWADGRLIPDFFRAAKTGESLKLRNPEAVRPWQFVLDPLRGYMELAQHAFESKTFEFDSFNFGPDVESQVSVSTLARLFQKNVPGLKLDFDSNQDSNVYENTVLKLNSEKSSLVLGWNPVMNLESAVEFTAQWYIMLQEQRNSIFEFSLAQVKSYVRASSKNEE